MAKLIKSDGTESDVHPQNGTNFSNKEIQDAIGGFYRPLSIGNGHLMLVNEDGLLHRLSVNHKASRMAFQTIVGDVLIIKTGELK